MFHPLPGNPAVYRMKSIPWVFFGKDVIMAEAVPKSYEEELTLFGGYLIMCEVGSVNG